MKPDHPVHRDRPWTQQSRGCARPGDFIYLPRSFLGQDGGKATSNETTTESSRNNDDDERARKLAQIGESVRNHFLRYRYGVFGEPGVAMGVGSHQHAFCMGRTVEEVIAEHSDLILANMMRSQQRQRQHHRTRTPKRSQETPSSSSSTIQVPPIRFTISGHQPPRYVLVLENSLAMDEGGHWDLIRRAAKKFVVHDLEPNARLGLVLFNEGAYVAHPAQRLSTTQVRQGVAVNIGNKFALVNKNGSCVRCGVVKAIEALQTSSRSAAVGGTVILVSQGKSTGLGNGEEKELMDLSAKHRLRVFSISIPRQPQDDLSTSLERLCHSSGGRSFFIPTGTGGGSGAESLATYVRVVDALREVQARTADGGGPYLVSTTT